MFSEEQLTFERVQILNESGVIDPDAKITITNDKILDMYKWMRKARLIDEKLLRMQRQGRIGTYAPFSGQEAIQIGSAFTLEKQDWICPSYRDLAACMVHGMPFEQVLYYVKGYLYGNQTPKDLHILPVQIIIAAQTLHAVGTAFASKLKNEKCVSVCYFGDGATSEGDFHEAMNFAAVYELPVVFICQNNQYAISVPLHQQMASRTIAQKAIAYGMKGVHVDGNDVIGVYEVVQEAVDRARNDGGPTLIEADTYRFGPHTTSDDPNMYRSKTETEKRIQETDPLIRVNKWLVEKSIWSNEQEEAFIQTTKEEMEEMIHATEEASIPPIEESFDYVYAQKPGILEEQKNNIIAKKQGNDGDINA